MRFAERQFASVRGTLPKLLVAGSNPVARSNTSCILSIMTGTITGTVKDDESGRPLAGAQVSIENVARNTVTDAQGRYRITVEEGTYTLKCNTLGYQPETRSVSVTWGGTSTVNFSLKPSDVPLPIHQEPPG